MRRSRASSPGACRSCRAAASEWAANYLYHRCKTSCCMTWSDASPAQSRGARGANPVPSRLLPFSTPFSNAPLLVTPPVLMPVTPRPPVSTFADHPHSPASARRAPRPVLRSLPRPDPRLAWTPTRRPRGRGTATAGEGGTRGPPSSRRGGGSGGAATPRRRPQTTTRRRRPPAPGTVSRKPSPAGAAGRGVWGAGTGAGGDSASSEKGARGDHP